MSSRTITFGSLLLLLASCSSKHPLASHWQQEVTAGAVGLELWFDDKDTVGGCNHQPGDADDDIDGKFTFADGKVTITGKWKKSGKPYTASGSLSGDRLELAGPDGKLTFRRSAP